ncbi:MAG: holin of superfamily 6 [Caudoviricetes sp.]|nr:MAG: holin of superfamily 6 [Caudoviricetes sp.]
MEFLVNNWSVLVAVIAVIVAVASVIYNFSGQTSQEQIEKLKEWLLIAVTEAEKELGSGTGELKLRYVYNLFLTKFPYLAKIISFEQFKLYIDEALDKLKSLLDNNENIKSYIEKK